VVFDFTHRADIPQGYLQHIIPMFMFLKDKYKADGSFDKVKGRLCAQGDKEDPEMVGDTFSPTVNPISVFTQLQITAKEGMQLSSYDIKGAFLISPLGDDKRVFLRIPRDVVEHWVRLYPERAEFVDNGFIYVELNKYMYGLREAPKAFHQNLDAALQDMGFTTNKADPCIYTLVTAEGRLLLSTHVDDLLLSAPTLRAQQWFERELTKTFEITSQYENLSYLGMSIKYDQEIAVIKVSQRGFSQEIVETQIDGKLRRAPPTPSTEDISTRNLTSPPTDKQQYLSLVMSLMYLARLTRPDLLFSVTTLATRSADPRESDAAHLRRVVRYLEGTLDRGLVFSGDVELTPKVYADASHSIHHDGKGHAGIFITLGSAPVLSRCFKIKLTTRSTSESELYTLEEASTYTEWYLLLLRGLGIKTNQPMPIYQDNKSTIIMAMVGGHFQRTKHFLVRQSFIKDQIDSGFCVLKYLKSEDMLADMMTKSLSSTLRKKHMKMLGIADT
jgi:hypothetical protein